MSDIQYTSAQILAVKNNPNDFPPKKIAEMIDAGCFTIDQLNGIKKEQREKVLRAQLAGKEDAYYKKCMGPGATVEDCEFFISNFPTSPKIKEIEDRKADIVLEKERQALLLKEEKDDLDSLSAKIDDLNLSLETKKNLIAAFLDKYPFTRFAKEVDALKAKAEDIEQNRRALEEERRRQQEDEDAWRMLLSHLASNWSIEDKRRAIDAYESRYFLHRSEVPAKRQQLTEQEDEAAWQRVLILLAQDIAPEQKVAALNNYKLQYSNHALEVDAKIQDAERERNIMPEINFVMDNPDSSVNDFMALIKKYPSKKAYIRQYILKDMIANPSRYTREAMYSLMRGKMESTITYDALFSIGELQEANIASYQILNHILTHPKDHHDRNSQEDSILPEKNFKSADNNTDIYFFGVPGSGKSTVLAGLLKLELFGNHKLTLTVQGEHKGINYANILTSYLQNNVFPQATKTRFNNGHDSTSATGVESKRPSVPGSNNNSNDNDGFPDVISGSIPAELSTKGSEVSDKFIQIIDAVIEENISKKNQENHKISIIEMPGERTLDFAASDVRDPTKLDQLLGEGTRELFMNGNRKVFFFVIDPKPKRTYTVKLNDQNCPMTQAQALEALVQFIGKVPGLLEKVDAMHIILTKSDLLSDSNDFNVIQHDVINNGYEGLVYAIKALCNPAKSKINIQCGHTPHLFTFSLGKVYPGHMIKYDKKDAEKIANVIIANTYSYRVYPTYLESIVKWMNNIES